MSAARDLSPEPDTDDALRRAVAARLVHLGARRLQSADDYLAYLEEQESIEATEELLAIPGFAEELAEAERQADAGEVDDLESVRRGA